MENPLSVEPNINKCSGVKHKNKRREKQMATSRFDVLVLMVLAAIPCLAFGIGAAMNSEFPKGAKLNLTLTVNEDGTGTLNISNDSEQKTTLQKLSNRMALVFLVMDEQGNVIAPTFKGKADPDVGSFALSPGDTHSYAFQNFDFHSGTGWCKYVLEEGKSYRVVAVYRPAGPKGPGFSSNEAFFLYTNASIESYRKLSDATAFGARLTPGTKIEFDHAEARGDNIHYIYNKVFDHPRIESPNTVVVVVNRKTGKAQILCQE